MICVRMPDVWIKVFESKLNQGVSVFQVLGPLDSFVLDCSDGYGFDSNDCRVCLEAATARLSVHHGFAPHRLVISPAPKRTAPIKVGMEETE